MSKVVSGIKDFLKTLWGLKVSIKGEDGREVTGPVISYLLVMVGAVGVLRAAVFVY
jgi:small nuclear ribonucleoprotein (snRNP)-like protein